MVNRFAGLMAFKGRAEERNIAAEANGVDSSQNMGDYSSYNEAEPTISEWVKSVKPSGSQVVDYIVSLFPFSTWITSYNLQWLAGDLVAGSFKPIDWKGSMLIFCIGITVGAVVIPQGMAYAKLAQLPVQFGLYSSFMGALVYWIFGTSKDINIGVSL
jgi:solute carrier family 26 (sodium-independent sulfate anion transporter), member 11